jgi:myo-inositol catabolism protein IolC
MPTSEELKHTHTHTQTTKSLVNWMADLNAECSTASYHPNDESDVFFDRDNCKTGINNKN